MRWTALVLLVATALAAPAAAQEPQASLDLDGTATATATATGAVTIAVPWRYTPVHDAATAASSIEVTWDADCGLGQGTGSSSAQGAATQSTITGTTTIALQLAGAVAETAYNCSLHGEATNAVPGNEASFGPGLVTAVLPLEARIEAVAPVQERTGKPQKQLTYPLELTNTGNGRIVVGFELLEEPSGRWEVLLPEEVSLEPGQKLTIPVVVATPFKNGRVTGSAGFVVVATPASWTNPDVTGEPVEVPLSANVEGMYVPGPSPLLVGVALAGLAVVARRRR